MSDADKWKRAVEYLRETTTRFGKALSYARFLGFTPEGVRLSFPPEAGFHRSTIFAANKPAVEEALSKYFTRPMRLLEETAPQAVQTAPKSIAEEEQSARNAREEVITHKVREHVAVKNVMRLLGGALEHLQVLEPASPAAQQAATTQGDAAPVDEES